MTIQLFRKYPRNQAATVRPKAQKHLRQTLQGDLQQNLQRYPENTHRVPCFTRIAVLLLLLTLPLSLTGCAKLNKDTKIVLTTGFTSGEIFRIEKMHCYEPEMMVYLTNIQNQYENIYGDQIWATEAGSETLEENVKSTVLAELAQIKTMNLMAVQYGVTLDSDEESRALEAANSYFSSLNDTEKSLMNVDLDTIAQLYQEYALAEKVYTYIISEINPEISDDEARIITVQQIFIQTDRDKAEEALRKIRDGEDFTAILEAYGEGNETELSFGKGEKSTAFETAAFNLGNDEVSDIIEDEDGYHIIKCVSTFNRAETDTNKQTILEQRRKETFDQEYDTFLQTLDRNMNQKLYDTVTFIHDANVKTADFFDVYEEYMGEFTKN